MAEAGSPCAPGNCDAAAAAAAVAAMQVSSRQCYCVKQGQQPGACIGQGQREEGGHGGAFT
jgi:hypothetical protein